MKIKKDAKKVSSNNEVFFPPVEDSEVFKYATGFWQNKILEI